MAGTFVEGGDVVILVDIYVPSVDQEFDFGLDENVKISGIIEEVASLVSQKEQCELRGNPEEFLLCSLRDNAILPRNRTLKECDITNGCRLILV